MQSPTPPTKPTPPTPPSKTSSTTTSTDTSTPLPKNSQSTTTLVKETPKTLKKDQDKSSLTPDPNTNVPPLGSYSNAKETTSETTVPSQLPTGKTAPASSGITIFLIVALVMAVTVVVIHWFKNNTPKKQSINYSTESTDDIVNLILSQTPAEGAPPVTSKPIPKKLLLKPAAKPKNKGGFEVRI